jgi:hypothetical protein
MADGSIPSSSARSLLPMTDDFMTTGQQVLVRLAGHDETTWHAGVAIEGNRVRLDNGAVVRDIVLEWKPR